MHIHEGVLSPEVLATGAIITVVGLAVGLRALPAKQVMPAALLAAGFFVASFVHFSIGTVNIHMTLNALLGILLGLGAFPAIFVALLLQAVLFGYGGLTVLGVNTVVMAGPAVLCGLAAKRLWSAHTAPSSVQATLLVATTLLASHILYVLALALSGKEFYLLAKIALLSAIPLIVVESIITYSIIAALYRIRPALFATLIQKT